MSWKALRPVAPTWAGSGVLHLGARADSRLSMGLSGAELPQLQVNSGHSTQSNAAAGVFHSP